MSTPSVLLPAETIVSGREQNHLVFGVLAPLSGIMGVIGPSVVNCARLAAEEASASGDGQLVDLVLIDAGRGPREGAVEAESLVTAGLVDGIVGCHTSDVRAAVSAAIGTKVPYVFTPPREFAATGYGSLFLGPAPTAQLLQPLRWLIENRGVNRWALVGSEYVWPQHVHAAARDILTELEKEVVYERTVPFGAVDVEAIVKELSNTRAQGIIVSLVGRDAVRFHREFAATTQAKSLLRLCTSFDEDTLLAVGGDTSGNLFAAMPSFLSDDDERHLRFLQAYEARFGELAPSAGSYAEGGYDGVHLLAALHMGGYVPKVPLAQAAFELLESPSRDSGWWSSPLGAPHRAVSLAQANGATLDVVSRFALA